MLFHVLFRILPHSFLFSTPVFKTMLKAKSQQFFCTQQSLVPVLYTVGALEWAQDFQDRVGFLTT